MGFGGGDVTNWDEDGYRNSILKERKIQTQTVFRTVFAPSPTPNPEAIVVASSDGSLASYSISSCVSYPPPLRVRDTRSQHFAVATPDCYIEGHDGPTYDIRFFGDVEDSLLISCGDDGRIRGWKWKELLKSEVPIHLRGTYLAPVLEFTNPQHKGPWNALSPIPENNGIAIDTQRGSIFAACGDSCAYCWDVEHGKIKMAFKGHSDYLHCVVARSSSNQIITGSEDGTARIWDCASGKCIQVIDPKKDKKSKELFPYVSCIALDASESWLACGSGQSLSIFNLPSRECVSRTPFHGSVQDISFHDNQILAVGTQPLVSRFDINSVLLSEIQSAPQSAFSISVHQSGVMAVAGYGGLVDVISPFGSHLCTFRCQCI